MRCLLTALALVAAPMLAKGADKLEAALRGAELRWTGETIDSRCNPTWMPWLLRRNEIWLALP